MESGGFKDGTDLLQSIFKNEQGQTISFEGTEECCSSAIFSTDVKVAVGATSHTSGSSAITTRNITNYPWENYYFPGSLVAVHCSGEYIAYAIKAPQKSTGMVRVLNRKSGDRGLVKNIRGMVRDLSFAHLRNRVILAFTDQYGTLSVIEVTPSATESVLNVEMLLEVTSEADKTSDTHRVIWCPYIPDEPGCSDDGDDPAYLLVLTDGCCAEVWKLNMLLLEHKSGTPITRDKVTTGYQLIKHPAPITAAAFSPDGTALATAAVDGIVKFFQVYMADEERSPRCLHQWNPHEGKPLSCIFFLDNHKRHSPEVQFWKYAVTGANNNSELKVWSCESWQCHQTLRFQHAQRDAPPGGFAFKAAMDPSANFLLLSDIQRRVMYVIAICQEAGSSAGNVSNELGSSPSLKNGGTSNGSAKMVSITELPVQYPALSLAVTDAAWKPYKRWKHDHAHNIHDDAEDDDGTSFDVVEGVVVRSVLINTKSLQEAVLRFQPALEVSVPKPPNSGPLDLSSSQDSIVVRDGMSDQSLTLNTSSVSDVSVKASNDVSGVLENQPPPPPSPDALTSPQSSNLASQHSALNTPTTTTQPPMNLLTPDSFSSPRKPEDDDMLEDSNEEGKQSNSKVVTPISNKYDVPYKNDFENAALSLLLRCGSGTLMPGGETESSNGFNILSSVVSGTSKSPSSTPLPPPPSETSTSHNMKTTEDAPLATSEAVVAAVMRAGTSATSSPSLEVQQILHSQNGKNGGYNEDDDDIQASTAELAEDEDIDDEDEEEEEPEALRQSRTQQPPKQQPLIQDKKPLSKTSPQPLSQAMSQPPPPPQSLSQSLSQPPSSLSMSQPPSSLSMSQPPSSLSMSQPPPPPVSLSQASSAISKPPMSMPEPPPSAQVQKPMLPLKSPLLLDLSPKSNQPLVDEDAQPSKTTVQPLTMFAALKGLPSQLPGLQSQLTCAQLEAEIKGGPVSPDSSCSRESVANQKSLQSKARNFIPVATKGEPIMRSVSESRVLHTEQAVVNGPVSPRVSPSDIAELRSLMMTSINLSREQNQEALTQTKEALSQTMTLAKKLDKAIQQVNQLAKQVQDVKSAQSHVQMELPHLVASTIRPVVEVTIRNEMRGTVMPGIIKSIDPVRMQLSQEVTNLSRNAENQIGDSVSKLIHSRNFVDSLGNTVSSAMGPTVQNSCRDAYNKMLLPGINALTQQVFSQVNDIFSRGTREYIQNVEGEIHNGRTAVQDNFTKASHSLNTACSALNTQTKALQENVNKLSSQQNAFADGLCERVKTLVKEEVSRALQEHQATVEAKSRAHTPVPSSHPQNPKVAQQQVQALISSGQFNTAFKQALTASDLSLVVFVCERVNPQQVFNTTPCLLSQDVLLSLVNQLSHDLSTYTDLKMKYLEEAFVNLEPAHPVTREHIRHVLKGFQQSLNTYLAANPNHKKVKMLLMAAGSLAANT